MEQTAFKIHIGHTDFYYHAACMDEAERRNVNNLSAEQMAEDKKVFTEVPLDQVPEDAVCSAVGCWQPIHH